jgi:molybdenum cofactor guanylyltransferase
VDKPPSTNRVSDAHRLDDVDAWVLSGGEGLRMQGQDKGLLLWQGQAMAQRVAQRLAPQVTQVHINANRNIRMYETWPWPVHADNPELPHKAGPMIGLLTGLQTTANAWLQLAPCDTPQLPLDMVQRLHDKAKSSQADVLVPVTTTANGETWHHWACALVSRQCANSLAHAVHAGERRLGQWIRQQRWAALTFDAPDDAHAFTNINHLHQAG